MDLVLARNLWGLTDDPERYVDGIAAVAAAPVGYDAVACPVQFVSDADRFLDALAEHGLRYVAQVLTFGRDVEEHLAMAREGLELAARFEPHHVVGQLGADRWDLDTATQFLREVERIAADLGVRLAHETHRSRILFNPWSAAAVVDALEGIELAADLSHWVCVAESLDLPDELIETVAAATIHVDCRVGHEEGPQVADPRVDAVARHLATFERWWDRIWELGAGAGLGELTLVPEFGPPPYQPVHPATGEPLADVNEINDWMAARLAARFRT